MRVAQTSTLAGAGTPRDPPLAALSRTAHLRHRYEEVDGGGVCRAGEAGRNGMGGRRKRMGARCGGHMRRDRTARDMELCASKEGGSPMN
jgi:hypothetical protein